MDSISVEPDIEKEYWGHVNWMRQLTVEYASDLDTLKVGSGFGVPGQKVIHPD